MAAIHYPMRGPRQPSRRAAVPPSIGNEAEVRPSPWSHQVPSLRVPGCACQPRGRLIPGPAVGSLLGAPS